MKRILPALLLITMLAAPLMGCAETVEPAATDASATTSAATAVTTTEATTVTAEATYDLEEVFQAILDAQANKDELVMFPESSPEIIAGFYDGIDQIELRQQVLYMHPVTGAPTEIMLVEVADEADVSKVKAIFEDRIASGANDTGYPENAAVWSSHAEVQVSGRYVAMIALPTSCTIPDNVFRVR